MAPGAGPAPAPLSMEDFSLPPMEITMGACLIGSFLSTALYGVTALQTYQYFDRFGTKDRLYIRILVVVTFLLDTFSVTTNTYSMWFYLIKHALNPLQILYIDWSLTVSVVSAAFTGFLVQSFYAYRVWILGNRSIPLPSLILILSTVSFAFALYYMVALFKNGSLLYIPSVTWASSTSLGASVVTDSIIAITMSIYLARGRRGFKRTDNIIQKLTLYTISTGVITSITTLLTLVLGEVLSDTFYNTIFYFPLSKCYVNSFLAFLNIREYLRHMPVTSQTLNLRTSEKQTGNEEIRLDTIQFKANTDLEGSLTATNPSGDALFSK